VGSGGGAVEEWRSSGERCGVEVRLGLALYRAEGEVERTAEAVAARSVSGRH
jgi:selenocysteine lyase/cysteine desulfurase